MANVTDRPDRERAQLVLVGGIVVALSLVALVLLLNTALFAENIATRGLGPAPGAADDHVAFTEEATTRVVRHEERIEYETWTAAKNHTEWNVQNVSEVVSEREFEQHGAFASLEVVQVRRGAALVQTDDTRNFTAGDVNTPRGNWTLAETTGIRNFTMTVDAAATDAESAPRNFQVVLVGNGGSGDKWVATVAETSSTVQVTANGKTCTSTDPVATINWSDGDLAGCSFPFAVTDSGASLDSPYQVKFKNGTNATGTYHLVVSNETGDDSVKIDSFGDPGTTDNPRQYPAAYSIVVEAAYEAPSVDYATFVRVAPGESELTRPP